MSELMVHSITSWGRHHRADMSLLRPERFSQLASALPKGSIIPIGCRRSYGDQCLNHKGRGLLMTQFNRFLEFDEDKGLLTAESGVTFHDILTHFLPRGFMPPVVPGTSFVTLGGALANDIHGKNHHLDGSFAAHVHSCNLMTAQGESLHLSRQQHPELFAATVGGCGLTGIITTITMKLKKIPSRFMKVTHKKASHWEALLECFPHKSTHPYEIAWLNINDGSGIFSSAHHQTGITQELFKIPRPKKISLPSWSLNAMSVKIFNHLYYGLHHLKPQTTMQSLFSYFFPLDKIHNWNEWYGKNGFHQCQLVLPHETSRAGLNLILQALRDSRCVTPLLVLKRLGKSHDESMLSFPMEGMTLAVDIAHHEDCSRLFSLLESITLDHQGRFYLAKDSFLSPQGFRLMYPRYEEWQKLQHQIDPAGVFSSNMGRRLKLVGNKNEDHQN